MNVGTTKLIKLCYLKINQEISVNIGQKMKEKINLRLSMIIPKYNLFKASIRLY